MKTLLIALLLQTSVLWAAPSPSPYPSASPSASPSAPPLLVGCKAKIKCGDGSEISCTASGANAKCTTGREKGLNYVECADDGVTFVRSTCTN